VLGFNEKFEIIKRLRKGETATGIAQTYGVVRTTVNDIKRDAEKLKKCLLTVYSSGSQRGRYRPSVVGE